MRCALLFGALTLGACGGGARPDAGSDGTGTDQALVARCFACHGAALGTQWKHASSHSLLLDCGACHVETKPQPGAGHQSSRECADCHSVKTHRDARCADCHDVHGTANLFLVRPKLAGVTIELATPAGLATKGLAQGTGSGACEVCHQSTAHYRRDGSGAPHETGWCITCHSHARGFSPDAGAP